MDRKQVLLQENRHGSCCSWDKLVALSVWNCGSHVPHKEVCVPASSRALRRLGCVLWGVLPSSPPKDSHAAFMNTLRRLLNSAELCLHFKIPDFSRPQISKPVAMLTSLFVFKSKCFLTLFPRNAGGQWLGKMVFSQFYQYFFPFIILISMKKVIYLKFKSTEE